MECRRLRKAAVENVALRVVELRVGRTSAEFTPEKDISASCARERGG
jgi:hypothetical protein